MTFSLNKLLIISGAVALVLVIIFFAWWWGGEIIIENEEKNEINESALPKSSLSGIACENYNRRPIAVMLAADPETRPLSGISEADIVFEMPVTPNGITRFMAVFQCNNPGEIGSIRSAREDFIPLTMGLGSIYVHWGGEKSVLGKLDNRITENIDGLKYDGTVFYRKKGMPMPHNGFTGLERLIDQSEKLGYNFDDKFSGYSRGEKDFQKNISNLTGEITINYPVPYDVKWVYDDQKKEYLRFRDEKPELDKNNNQQVSARVVVILKTNSRYISKDYISVVTQGGGEAMFYQGEVSSGGKWQKDSSRLDSKLYFYDNDGKEMEFLPGKMWIEIVATN